MQGSPWAWLKQPSPTLRYTAALLVAALAQVARWPLNPPTLMPFITYVPFVLLAAAFGGLGPGLASAALCCVESIWFATAPVHSFGVADPRHWLGIAALALAGVVASTLFGRLKRSEERLRAANLEATIIQRSAPVMLLVMDEQLRVRKANDLAVQFAGLTASGAVGLGPGDAIGCVNAWANPEGCGHSPACPACSIRRAASDTLLTGKNHNSMEAWVSVSTAGGESQARCWLISTVAMQFDASSRSVLVCAQDITERKHTESQVIEQRDRLQRQSELINFSHDAIIVADANRTITGWNNGAEEMYGWTEYEAQGNIIHELLHTSAAISTGTIDEILGREGRWDGELEHDRRDGTRLIAESRQVLLRDGYGNPACILEINRDITERKQAEAEVLRLNAGLEQRVRERTAQLEAANAELESFAYSVSHDLRSPLRGIDGWSLALVEDFGGQLDHEARHYLDRVRSEAQRMGQLIDDLLRLSRVTRAPLDREAVDLTALARSIADQLREIHADRRIEFAVEPDLKAIGDARLLEVALTNLLGNAAKFTGKRPEARIEFGCVGENGTSTFFVRDNGAGFDMSYARSLFGPFQRLHRASDFPGSGIGLATVQRIIHRHGGRIWAEAQVERGATFYFTLG